MSTSVQVDCATTRYGYEIILLQSVEKGEGLVPIGVNVGVPFRMVMDVTKAYVKAYASIPRSLRRLRMQAVILRVLTSASHN